MPYLKELYLENRYLKLSPHYPRSQPKNWIHAFIAKVLDSSEIAAMDDPQHFSSSPLYQHFVQLCLGLHPRSIKPSNITPLFEALYQIDKINVSLAPDSQEFQEKIFFPSQHRLQYSLALDPSLRSLNHYEVRSYFIFDKKIVVLQFLCQKSNIDLPGLEPTVFWQIDYLLELYHVSSETHARFHNKKELFCMNHNDVLNRISSLQLISITKNNIPVTEMFGYSPDATGMRFERADYGMPKYVVSELKKHKYLMAIHINDVASHHFRRLMRTNLNILWATDGDYVMSVTHNHHKRSLYFGLYDETDSSLEQYQKQKLALMVVLNPVSLRLEALTIAVGQMAENNQLQAGLNIRFLVTGDEPLILINVIKRNIRTSLTYRLIKRSTLEQLATIDEDVNEKLYSLLLQSRLLVALTFIIAPINLKDYCFMNKADTPYTPSTGTDDIASIADLDELLTDAKFCPRLSERSIELIINNVRQCSLPEHYFTQAIIPEEESARSKCINAYAQGLDELMALQRNEFARLESIGRNKLEQESLNGFMQINKKCEKGYLHLIGLLFLTARDNCELRLFFEYQQQLIRLIHIHRLEVSEHLERRLVETRASEHFSSMKSVRSGFFDTLERKREAVIQCVSQRREMVDAARDNVSRLQRDEAQRRPLQAIEQETRERISSASLRTLNHLFRFNTVPVTGPYTQAQLFELGHRTHKVVEQYVELLKQPYASNTHGQSILETLFLAEDAGWDVFMGGSASRGSPWANDLDIKLSPADKQVTDEQRLKLFLILEALLDGATDVRGYPEKGLMTFDIPGLRLPVNVVIYLTYKGQYYNEPLYNDDVVVRIKRESQAHLSSRQRAVGGAWLQFYRHHYHPSNAEHSGDEIIDLITVAHILQTQHIHACRSDPPGILRVLRDIAYCPDKERVNAEPLKALIAKMQADASSTLYQDTLYEFYKGKHQVAPAYFQAFLHLLNRYGLPECGNLSPLSPHRDGRLAGKPTRYGYAHLIELLVDRYKLRSASATRWTVLECIEQVLERQGRKEFFAAFCDFAPPANDSGCPQPSASSCTQ